MSFYDKLKFDASGLIPAIVQEQGTGRVLMMAWMNRASLEKTISTGKTHFWSRSRQKFWMKGEESGNTQTVRDIAFDFYPGGRHEMLNEINRRQVQTRLLAWISQTLEKLNDDDRRVSIAPELQP